MQQPQVQLAHCSKQTSG